MQAKITAFFTSCLIFIMVFTSLSSSNAYATIIESNIPDIGQRSHSISKETESLIGQGLMQSLQGSEVLIEDPVVNAYLHELSLKLGHAAQHLDVKLHFFAINNPELNAFAFFGGHVAVHTGLILFLKNESELAAVLAHETAHIAQKHLARSLANNKRMMPLTYAELIAAIAIGALGSPEAASHLATAALGAHMQRIINFTREHEQEADRVGIQILAKAGFAPTTLPTVLKSMSAKLRYHEKPPEYLLTHPLFESRIADCANRAERMSYHQTPDNLFFHLIRARIALDFPTVNIKNQTLLPPDIQAEFGGINTKTRVQLLHRRLMSGQYTNKVAAEYTYALALAKDRQYSASSSILSDLLNADPDNWIIDLTIAEVHSEASDLPHAIEHLAHLYERYPKNPAIVLNYAHALLKTKKTAPAEKILSLLRKDHPEEPQILQLLARIYSQNANPIALHRTQAEWHYSRGEFKEAYLQLDRAVEYALKDPQTVLVIKERKRRLEALEKQQKDISL